MILVGISRLPRAVTRLPWSSLRSTNHHQSPSSCTLLFSTSPPPKEPNEPKSLTPSKPRLMFKFQEDPSSVTVAGAGDGTPPKPPKDFALEYRRAPFYSFAFKGDMSYKEMNWFVIKLVAFGVVGNLLFIGWAYYEATYLQTPEERARAIASAPYHRLKGGKGNEEVDAFKASLMDFQGLSDLGAWFIKEDTGGKMPEKPVEQRQTFQATQRYNPDDITDRAIILDREEMGRKNLYKTIADFDADLRQEKKD